MFVFQLLDVFSNLYYVLHVLLSTYCFSIWKPTWFHEEVQDNNVRLINVCAMKKLKN